MILKSTYLWGFFWQKGSPDSAFQVQGTELNEKMEEWEKKPPNRGKVLFPLPCKQHSEFPMAPFLQGQEKPVFLPPGIFSSCCPWAARPNQLAAISC